MYFACREVTVKVTAVWANAAPEACKEKNLIKIHSKRQTDCHIDMARNDFRYRWLSETISMLLGIFDTKYADTLIDENGENITRFFDDEITEFAHINRQTLFVWRTFYDKMVEETITVLEEGKIIN